MAITEQDRQCIIEAAERCEFHLAESAAFGDGASHALCLYYAEMDSNTAFFFAGVRNDWTRQRYLPLQVAA